MSNNDSLEMTEAKTASNILEDKRAPAKMGKAKLSKFEEEQEEEQGILYELEN